MWVEVHVRLQPEIYHNILLLVFAGLIQLLASNKGTDQAILSAEIQINVSFCHILQITLEKKCNKNASTETNAEENIQNLPLCSSMEKLTELKQTETGKASVFATLIHGPYLILPYRIEIGMEEELRRLNRS